MRGSFSFKIQILDKKFSNSPIVTTKTARIVFTDNHTNVQQITEYGVVELDYIYDKILNNQTLILDNCYVNNFSLNQYKKNNAIALNDYVEIHNFSAKNSFFQADELIDFSRANFVGDSASFKQTLFGSGHLSFFKTKFNVKNKIDFSEVFLGKGHTNFQYAKFFNAEITFEKAVNVGNLTFVNSNFGDGNITFKNMKFGDGVIEFHFSKFGNGHITFYKCSFEGEKIDFRRIEFGNGKLDFRRVDFGNAEVLFDECEVGIGKTSFKKARFGNGNISFNLSQFISPLTFEKAKFGNGNVTFFKTNLKSISFKSCHLNSYLDLRFAQCQIVDLSDTVVRDVVDFKNNFSKVNISQLNLIGLRNLGKLILNWELNQVEKLIENQNVSDFEKAEQFRIIKENFRASGQYDDEDKAYVKFKRYELENKYKIAKNKGGFVGKTAYPIKIGEKILFDYMGKYATQPFRVLFSMFIIYLSFSFVYFFMIKLGLGDLKPAFSNPEQMSDIILAFYHSAITFLTIGYGDYAPWGVIRIISSFEGFVGLFMMSYFTVAFVRKILR